MKKKRVSTVPAATGKNTPPSRSGEDKSGASKRDVQNYLRNQNKKEDDSNNPFAAAFDKLNL